MGLRVVKTVPLLAIVACIALAVVVTEDIAAFELAHHEHIEGADDSAVRQRAKAAAEFLDTLPLASFFLGLTTFAILIQKTFYNIEEYMPCLSSLITLKIRSNS